ncbi:hypothetical protein CAAN1_07S03048 [[Candida] anglica]|uniref:Transcription regulator Rua1 C-terminal domain-containing protein n=1 Tax=[Candida] anglica TaxID=148631 RepID=A0ABP0EBN5_9ASCO
MYCDKLTYDLSVEEYLNLDIDSLEKDPLHLLDTNLLGSIDTQFDQSLVQIEPIATNIAKEFSIEPSIDSQTEQLDYSLFMDSTLTNVTSRRSSYGQYGKVNPLQSNGMQALQEFELRTIPTQLEFIHKTSSQETICEPETMAIQQGVSGDRAKYADGILPSNPHSLETSDTDVEDKFDLKIQPNYLVGDLTSADNLKFPLGSNYFREKVQVGTQTDPIKKEFESIKLDVPSCPAFDHNYVTVVNDGSLTHVPLNIDFFEQFIQFPTSYNVNETGYGYNQPQYTLPNPLLNNNSSMNCYEPLGVDNYMQNIQAHANSDIINLNNCTNADIEMYNKVKLEPVDDNSYEIAQSHISKNLNIIDSVPRHLIQNNVAPKVYGKVAKGGEVSDGVYTGAKSSGKRIGKLRPGPGSQFQAQRRNYDFGIVQDAQFIKVEEESLINRARLETSVPIEKLIANVLIRLKPEDEERVTRIPRTRYIRGDISYLEGLIPNMRFEYNPCFGIDRPYEPEFICYLVDPENGLALNSTRCGLCAYCEECHFRNFKTSTFLQHYQLHHGIHTDNYLTPNPSHYGDYLTKKDKNLDGRKTHAHEQEHTGVVCPICYEVVETECSKATIDKPLTAYLRHFRDNHRKSRYRGDRTKYYTGYAR